MKPVLSSGFPYPLGATVQDDGINFAIFSRHATAVYLELFAAPDDNKSICSISLDPRRNRTGDMWHIFVHNLKDGQLYGYRVDGPYSPLEDGHRFNVNKLLCDPYARSVSGRYEAENDALYGYDRKSPKADLSFSHADSAPYTVKSVAIATSSFDWEDTQPIRRPLDQSVFYEVHVKGLSHHPSSSSEHAGSYLGVIDKIPHLQKLGVTAVELLPVHHFNAEEPCRTDPTTGKELMNYWGYSSLGFFAPEPTYRYGEKPSSEVEQFRKMVKELHRAGIEVILDVVFNHTGEGDQRGPTLGFRGFDNSIYYMLSDNRYYRNYSGCGNTVNCSHPLVKQLIRDSLRYWLVEMHVDGFRFDLATILGRDRRGAWVGDLSLLYDIGGDPVLRGCKLIAESWDAEGMYKVGEFPQAWAEWNGRYRDDIRRFVRGDGGAVADLARRLGGSRDLFGHKVSPTHSINFLTAHDGFTLRDLVSYEQKHNERNGEDSKDGCDQNHSRNWGVEGETDDRSVRSLRLQQAKNLLTILMLSRGTPMLLGGDELWRTKAGNNNTYSQDNELSWLDWTLDEEAAEMLRFNRLLTRFRREHPALRRERFVDPFASDGIQLANSSAADITWHGIKLQSPDWSYNSHTLALHYQGTAKRGSNDEEDSDIYAIFNAWSKPLDFELPGLGGPLAWHRIVDSSLPSPNDFVEGKAVRAISSETYHVAAHSTVVLVALPS
jgi:isoamylase